MKRVLKIIKVVVIVLVVLLVGLRLILSPVVKSVANKILPEALGTEASLGDVSFGFLGGFTGLGDLRIGQPRGFDAEDKDLFRFARFEVKVKPGTLRAGTLEVERLETGGGVANALPLLGNEPFFVVNGDALRWLANVPADTIHGIVTDPPYGLIEYEDKDHEKMRAGRGGVWRIPPSFAISSGSASPPLN